MKRITIILALTFTVFLTNGQNISFIDSSSILVAKNPSTNGTYWLRWKTIN